MAIKKQDRRTKTSVRLQMILNTYGIKAATLARESGLSRSTICRYLSGALTPTRKNAEKLGKVLSVSPEWIRGEDDITNLSRLAINYNRLNDAGKARVIELSDQLLNTEEYVLINITGDAV